jgi:hypothetical protein
MNHRPKRVLQIVTAEAARHNVPIRLLLIGDGPTRRPSRIVYASPVCSRHHLRRRSRRCSRRSCRRWTFFYFLRCGGLPLPVLEAQAAGLSCVISDIISAETDVPGLITALSAVWIAACAAYSHGEPPEWSAMAEARLTADTRHGSRDDRPMECASHGGRGPVEKAGYPPHRTCRGDNPIPLALFLARVVHRRVPVPRSARAPRSFVAVKITRRGHRGQFRALTVLDVHPKPEAHAAIARSLSGPSAQKGRRWHQKNRMHWREPASGAERSSVLPHGGSTRARTFRTHRGASCLQTATR